MIINPNSGLSSSTDLTQIIQSILGSGFYMKKSSSPDLYAKVIDFYPRPYYAQTNLESFRSLIYNSISNYSKAVFFGYVIASSSIVYAGDVIRSIPNPDPIVFREYQFIDKNTPSALWMTDINLPDANPLMLPSEVFCLVDGLILEPKFEDI